VLFKEVIGQEEVKKSLITNVKKGRISHAQLFVSGKGTGGIPLAIAYAQYILCENRSDNDSCGECPSCKKIKQLSHPDVHFSYPFILSEPKVNSDRFISDWRIQVLKEPYFDLDVWNEAMDAGTKKPIINVEEAINISHKIGLKSFEGGYKILILWMPEMMNPQTANKLLKLLEEPPDKTIFIFVSHNQEQLLTTIQSRMQVVKLQSLSVNEVCDYLIQNYQVQEEVAHELALLSELDVTMALQLLKNNEGGGVMINTFIEWMRLCYKRDAVEAVDWVDKIAKEFGREEQKNFLLYCLQMFRQCIIGHYSKGDLIMSTKEQKAFLTKFAPFINAQNIVPLHESLEEAIYHLDRNGNSKLVLLDVTLKVFAQIKKVT
jgi:DNA polymerase III subunit delta'